MPKSNYFTCNPAGLTCGINARAEIRGSARETRTVPRGRERVFDLGEARKLELARHRHSFCSRPTEIDIELFGICRDFVHGEGDWLAV